MGDGCIFPGSRETISAWDMKERFIEGLKLDEVVVVIDYPIDKKVFKGRVKECWKDEGGNQFFILESLEGILMGVSFYSCPNDLTVLLEIANELKKEIDYLYLPGPGLMAKRIIIGTEEHLAFLFNMFFRIYRGKNFCSCARIDNVKTEKNLSEAVKWFKKEYRKLREKNPTLPEII